MRLYPGVLDCLPSAVATQGDARDLIVAFGVSPPRVSGMIHLMSASLEGQVALVTGASRGIGQSVGCHLAARGVSVGITARDEAGLEVTRRQIEDAGARAILVPGDVTSPDDVDHVVTTVTQELGPIDILVNNAGRAGAGSANFVDIDRQDWWNVVEVNLLGPMLFMQAVLPSMIERDRGRIFNMGSLIANGRVRGFSHYAVSKTALLRLTDTVALELESTGVSLFDVSPGLVRTDMTEEVGVFRDIPDEDWTPIERIGEVIVQLCAREYDGLSGRFFHAEDDIAAVATALRADPDSDGRKMRLVPYGPSDDLLT